MNKLKRVSLALMLIACMALSACGSTDADSAPTDTNSSSQASQSQTVDSSTVPDSSQAVDTDDAWKLENTPASGTVSPTEYVGRILHPAAAVFYSCGGEI